jgi:hypothetical protein
VNDSTENTVSTTKKMILLLLPFFANGFNYFYLVSWPSEKSSTRNINETDFIKNEPANEALKKPEEN